jgi:NAD(P)-dependent dehydrogenase (short-subunit alcohol dehydrogenase family)
VQALDLRDGFDVSDPTAWDEVGPVELACLNAGVETGEAELARVSDAAYRRIVGTNIDGVVLGTRRLAQVAAPGTSIVATASLAGLTAMPRDPLYTLTKHAVVGFVRAVAPQLATREIVVNAVAPGFADTPIVPAESRERMLAAGFPLLSADDVARVVLLAGRSGESGQVWVVQPGRDPMPFRFPNVPGPRDAEGRPVGLPPA